MVVKKKQRETYRHLHIKFHGRINDFRNSKVKGKEERERKIVGKERRNGWLVGMKDLSKVDSALQGLKVARFILSGELIVEDLALGSFKV